MSGADEAEFHDAWAAREVPEQVDVEAAFSAPTAMEARFTLQWLGSLAGIEVLDVGTGLGESAVAFARRGASVTATDLSPKMIEFTQRLADRYEVKLRTVVCPAERLAAPDASFDVVHLANLLHHVQNRAEVFAEIRRVLRPGGRWLSWDPIRYNPVINVYRRIARKVRTENEHPLGLDDLRMAKRFFPDTSARFFWLTSQALFLKYFLVDRVGPNESRYWKRILEETPESLRWWLPLERLDRTLTAVPGLRWLSWNIALFGSKPQ